MGVKMTPDQFRGFMAADWGPDPYWEEVIVLLDGEECPEDDDPLEKLEGVKRVEIVGGVIIPDQRKELRHQETVDVERFARSWLKAQKTTTILVEVDKDLADSLREHIGTFKGARMVKL